MEKRKRNDARKTKKEITNQKKKKKQTKDMRPDRCPAVGLKQVKY